MFLFRSSPIVESSAIGLIQIGSCPLHLIHNSFKIAFDSVEWSIEEFLHHLVLWFNRSPPRRDDYLKVVQGLSNDVGKFIRRLVITRWLDIGPILDRAIKQWTNLQHYFLNYLPTNDRKSIQTHRYIEIQTMLQNKLTLIRMKFLVFLYHTIYEQTLVWFQQTQPLIHLLYEECEQLVRRLFSCFIDDDLLAHKTLDELLHIPFQVLTNQKSNSSKR